MDTPSPEKILAQHIAGLSRLADGAVESYAGGQSISDCLAISLLQGTHPLLYDLVYPHQSLWSSLTSVEQAQLTSEAHKEIAREQLRRTELGSVLDALSQQGVFPLLFKGAPLAYRIYAKPWIRTRGDSDLLIREEDKSRTFKLLNALGYEAGFSQAGNISVSERAFYKTDGFDVQHALDIHWRINNSSVLSRLLSMEELNVNAVAVPQISDAARTCSDLNALLIACLHRAAHFHHPKYKLGNRVISEADSLLWLYDIHLLCSLLNKELNKKLNRELNEELNEGSWNEFQRITIEKSMAELVIDALQTTSDFFGTDIPAGVMTQLKRASGQIPLASLKQSQLRAEFTHILSAGSVKNSLLSLGEHLFPPRDYIQEKYGLTGKSLPVLAPFYLYRIVRGGWARLIKRD